MFGDERNPLKLATMGRSGEKNFAALPKDQGPRNDRVRIPGDMRRSDADSAVISRGVNAHLLPATVWMGRQFARTGGPALCPQGNVRGRAPKGTISAKCRRRTFAP